MGKLEIAKRLKEYREKSGLTVYQVGEQLGKSGKTVSAWENGRGQPDADIFLELCEIYGVDSVGYFFGESEKVSPSSEAQEIAILFDKADDHDKETVRHVLGRYSGVEIAKELHPNTREKVI